MAQAWYETGGDLLTAGALAILAKKLIEGSTTTRLLPVGTTTSRFFGGRSDITQEEWKKGFQEMMDFSTPYKPIDISRLPISAQTGEKLDHYPTGNLFGLGPITEIKQAVDIQPYVGPSTFKFGTKIDNSGKLSL